MTAKSLRRLDRLTASSDSSPHSRVIEWLQTSESMPPPSSVVEPVPISEPQPSLPLGAEAVVSGPRSARVSRTSHSTRRAQSVTSTMAIEHLGYTREIHGHLLNAVGQMQTQAEAQRAEAKQREEAQRAEARQREETPRADNLQLLVQLKLNADQANAEREKMMAENDLKRQRLLVETNAALLQEKMRADLQKDMEVQRFQQKERDRAIAAQQQLRELAAQELQERVNLERKLAEQQQQALLLQEQGEIDRLEVQVDKRLLEQKLENLEKQAPNAQVKARENVTTPSPGAATVELINSDALPPVVIDASIPASDSLVLSTALPAMSQVPGVAAGMSPYTGHGPSITPRGPEVATTPLSLANSDLSQVVNTTGVHSVGLPVIDRPPSGLPSYLAYGQQCLVPPMLAQPYASSDVAVASAAPPLSVGVSTTSVVQVPSSNVVVSGPVATIGAGTRATYASLGAPLSSAPPVVDTKAVPLVGNPTQVSAVGSLGQTPGIVVPVAAPAAPTVVVKQPEPVRPYTGTTSYK